MSETAAFNANMIQATWKCRLSADADRWAVGDKKQMVCQGSALSEPLNSTAQVHFEDPKFEYSLRILEVKESSLEQAFFTVTGYKPGSFKNASFIIQDGMVSVQVEPMDWAVSSILPPNEQVEPYGPIGPLALSIPWWFWAGIGFVVLIVSLFAWAKIRKHLQRRRLREKLKSQNTALGAYHQFAKDLRSINRAYLSQRIGQERPQAEARECFFAIDKAFRLFLVRQLLVPAEDWGLRAILAEIKKYHRPVYEAAGASIRQILYELEKAKKEEKKISFLDCEQMVAMSRTVADKVYQVKK